MEKLGRFEKEFDYELLTDKEKLEKYARDETPGDYYFLPDAAFLPTETDSISRLLEIDNDAKIPIIPRGGGTSRTAGPLAVNGGIVLSTEKMNEIIDFDEKNCILEVGPGVITEEINKFLEKYGFFFPPDPSSVDSCFIGGNVATNAGGARCLLYGLTRDYVRGIEVILPDGSKEFLGGRLKKDATGYSLLNLLIGSEGTLGIITRILLEVVNLPPYSATLVAPFKKLEDAALSSFNILSSGITPSAFEIIDEDAVKVAITNLDKKIPMAEEGTLLIAELLEDSKGELEKKFEIIGNKFLESNASDVFVAEENHQQEKIWDFRRNITEALDLFGTIIPEDVSIPRANIPEFIPEIKKLEKEFNTRVFTFGHIGDGNLHVNILKNEEWKDNGDKIINELFKKLNTFGGKISGEHGIGFTKKKYLKYSRTEKEIKLMKNIKSEFDPLNILNPGKIFDIEEKNA
ncbi:FAD-binding protein [candidate division WOR-3 bacterium]|nr:FAD-binding protein [candidate division WOR-3 bacterium]